LSDAHSGMRLPDSERLLALKISLMHERHSLQVNSGECLGFNASASVAVLPAQQPLPTCAFPGIALTGRCATWCLSNATAAGGILSLLSPGVLLVSMFPSSCAPSGAQFTVMYNQQTGQWLGTVDTSLSLPQYAGSSTLTAAVTRGGNGRFTVAFKLLIIDEDPVICPAITPVVSYAPSAHPLFSLMYLFYFYMRLC
jgi:hypothetical protein